MSVLRRRDGGTRRAKSRVGTALAVAAAALAAAGACGGGDDAASLPPVDVPTSPILETVGTEFEFTPDRIAVPAGEVEVVLINRGLVIHDIRLEGRPELIVEAAAGQTATGVWVLEEGRYEMYCSIPGHRAAGMEGILEVR